MTDEEMVAYLVALPRRPRRAAPVDRDAAARVPAGGARRPRPRRRDLLARERARPGGGGARGARRRRRRRDVPAARVRALEAGRRARGCAGGRARPPRARHLGRHARGVVRADARARRPSARSTSAPQPRRLRRARRSPVESFLVRLRGRLSAERRVVLAADREPARARRPARCRADRRDAQHARPHAPDRRPLGRRRRRSTWRASSRDHGVDAEGRSSSRASACVAAGARHPRGADARLEIAAHTHASVAATLDRFGGASWLDDAEVARLRVLAARALQADARCRRRPSSPDTSRSSPAPRPASAATSPATSRRAAPISCSPTSTRTGSPDRRGLDRAVAVAGDLTDPAVVDRVVRTAVASFGGLDAVVLNAGIASTGRARGARRRRSGAAASR